MARRQPHTLRLAPRERQLLHLARETGDPELTFVDISAEASQHVIIAEAVQYRTLDRDIWGT